MFLASHALHLMEQIDACMCASGFLVVFKNLVFYYQLPGTININTACTYAGMNDGMRAGSVATHHTAIGCRMKIQIHRPILIIIHTYI